LPLFNHCVDSNSAWADRRPIRGAYPACDAVALRRESERAAPPPPRCRRLSPPWPSRSCGRAGDRSLAQTSQRTLRLPRSHTRRTASRPAPSIDTRNRSSCCSLGFRGLRLRRAVHVAGTFTARPRNARTRNSAEQRRFASCFSFDPTLLVAPLLDPGDERWSNQSRAGDQKYDQRPQENEVVPCPGVHVRVFPNRRCRQSMQCQPKVS